MKVLFMAGSGRKESLNKKLARAASDLARSAGADVTFIDLADFPMPIYNGDLEDDSGLPENALALKKIFTEQDALFIATPEYNGSFPALLKNTLDWLSRSHYEGEPRMSAYTNKVVALAAASPGGFGGMRSLMALRLQMAHLNTLVISQQMALAKAGDAFDEEGSFKDDKKRAQLDALVKTLMATTRALAQDDTRAN
ncbi:NAD(P)H-dependent oxidoreductase [Teredinibacter turnerae]|uniref:NADPH-dependent FMN reductase n=1 Tax=Teredinibacter turnerae TaxID=2426 RepID=UPI0030CA6D2C